MKLSHCAAATGLVALTCIGFASLASATPMFTGLGDLPGGTFWSRARDVSADGSVVVGQGTSASGPEAFRWTATGGMVGIGDLAGGNFESNASAVSADGSVIVGTSISDLQPCGPPVCPEAFRWTASGAMVGLGDLPGGTSFSMGRGVSADGSVVVGNSGSAVGNTQAFRWTASGGMVGLDTPPGSPGGSAGVASAASADGSIVVGQGKSVDSGVIFFEAMLWQGGVPMALGDLPGGDVDSKARAVSPDGSVVVGVGRTPAGDEAFRWESGVMTGLGHLPGGVESAAFDVSADGSLVVGTSGTGLVSEAFIWDSQNGMRRLEDVLTLQLGLGASVSGWTLTQASGISDDGLTIVGWGTNPSGQQEAWLAQIPEPSSALLLGLGVGALALFRGLSSGSRGTRHPSHVSDSDGT